MPVLNLFIYLTQFPPPPRLSEVQVGNAELANTVLGEIVPHLSPTGTKASWKVGSTI